MSIDWTKPVYEKGLGIEVFALHHPDGSAYLYEGYRVRVMGVDGQDLGWWRQDHPSFTNTPPVQDWESKFTLFPDHLDIARGLDVTVRVGRRNGIPFAEVVE